jgi:3'-phosphoadenosine 5'-phosphosulfate sulfotransferase (PAPS reductase)/FAD synthetase
MPDDNVRHVLGLSGGKDSAALAIYMRDRVPETEYFFCDTGSELPETYEYLERLESYLGKRIVRLNSGRDFDHWLSIYRGALPSPQMRWCTRQMKIKPLEAWIGSDQAVSYVAIRADEASRVGYISTKPNIRAVYPLKDDGIDKEGVLKILADAGVGLPAYTEWGRTRSGCYFCFFQRKAEWVGLADRHPELFDKAVAYEDKLAWEATATEDGQYTWSQGETLRELLDRREDILAKHEAAMNRAAGRRRNIPLIDVLSDALDEDNDSAGCLVCHLCQSSPKLCPPTVHLACRGPGCTS